VTKIYIEAEPWTTEDLMTHTFKLKRYVGNSKYSEIFERLYN
jgi:long-subunit acyl-CoA synthetase (AMP-forming)